MPDYCIAFVALGMGFVMSLGSVFLGIKISYNMAKGSRGLLSAPPSPVGDVFTIEDVEDAEPFPKEEDSKAQEHILERTNKFLQTLGGK